MYVMHVQAHAWLHACMYKHMHVQVHAWLQAHIQAHALVQA